MKRRYKSAHYDQISKIIWKDPISYDIATDQHLDSLNKFDSQLTKIMFIFDHLTNRGKMQTLLKLITKTLPHLSFILRWSLPETFGRWVKRKVQNFSNNSYQEKQTSLPKRWTPMQWRCYDWLFMHRNHRELVHQSKLFLGKQQIPPYYSGGDSFRSQWPDLSYYHPNI